MTLLKRLAGGLLALFRKSRAERDLDDELNAYLDASVQHKMTSGFNREEAARRARLEIGSRESVKDRVRDAGWESLLETVWRDVRYGVRNLGRSPGFALAALATLTFTIGASTAAFTLLNGVLLAPLPFEEPDRLISLLQFSRSAAGGTGVVASPLETVRELEARLQTVEGLAAASITRARLERDGPPEVVELGLVTADYFEMLRVQPVLGQVFGREPPDDGTTPVLISYGHWQSQWGGAAEAIGATFRLEGQPVMTVVGVLPETFRAPATATLPAQVWAPVEGVISPAASFAHTVLGRLRPGETPASAQAELEIAAAAVEGPESAWTWVFTPLFDQVVGADARRALLTFSAAVGMLLLIGVLNLVNLQASRISKRQSELAIRAALGASRSHLLRQMIAETTVLTVSGAALSLLILHLVRDSVLARMPPLLPRLADIPLDGRVFAFAVALALLSGLLVGVVPALRASRPEVNATLKEDTPRTTETRQQRWLRGLFTMAQTSLAVVLLVGAGLLIHSFWRLLSVDPGFDSANVMTARISVSQLYSDPTARNGLIARLLEDVRSRPGVELAAVTSQIPMGGQGVSIAILTNEDGSMLPAIQMMTSDDFGRVMGIPLRSGRWFTESEAASGPSVVVISESLARLLWPGEDPVGQRFERLGPAPLIVGVAGDVRFRMRIGGLRQGFYTPYTTSGPPSPTNSDVTITLAVRLAEDASVDLRSAVLQVEPDSTVTVTAMRDLIGADVASERFQTAILTLFAAAALILATLGVYSVVAFSTAQRTREIGLRMALGAKARQVVVQMMREGAIPAVVGLIIGVAASLMLTRFLESYLFEIEPTEPWTYVAVAAVGIIVTLLAAWLPARRAAAVDPMTALRCE